jgi:hypothetical protein
MRYWLRELAGWLLVGLGLYVFLICYALLLSERPWILEAGPLTLIGIIIFRGGIHLLKTAVAARVCLHAQAQASAQEAAQRTPRGRPQQALTRHPRSPGPFSPPHRHPTSEQCFRPA